MLLRALLFAVPVLLVAGAPKSYKIQTIAGTDFVGDGGAATAAILSQPEGVVVDAAGNVYVADADDHRIRMISPDGMIQTIAGTGLAGFSGDGGPAAAAQLNRPYGLAMDAAGNLYIADLGNARVRQITPDGQISTVAGGSSTGTPATEAQLNAPRNLAIGPAGELFIADFGANQVYKVSGGVFTIVAGTGKAGFSGDGGLATKAELSAPAGLAVDAQGNLYIADSGNQEVREVSQGTIASIFNIPMPTGLALNSSGTLYVAAPGYFGTLTHSLAAGMNVEDVAVDANGNLYLSGGSLLNRMSPDGTIAVLGGNGASRYYGGDGGPAAESRLHTPLGIVQDDLGNTFIADTENHRIRRILASGIMTTFAGTGEKGAGDGKGSAALAQFNAPRGVALDSMRNLYVADSGNNRVCKITAAGVFSVVADQLNDPEAVTLDNQDVLYIADTGNDRVLKVDNAGLSVVTSALRPAGLAFNQHGTLFVSEDNRISQLPSGGTLMTLLDGMAAPRGLQVTPSGDLVVAESGKNRILWISAGVITPIAGSSAGFSGDGGPALSGQLNAPSGVALDSGGNIRIADAGNNRIRMLAPAGVISPEQTSQISIANAASLAIGAIAPGEIITIFGSGLDGAQVFFDGTAAVQFYTGAAQINALAPQLTPGATTDLTIAVGGITVAESTVAVEAAVPALFAAAQGTGQAAALNEDGSYNSAANPAPRGTVMSLYATGWSDPSLPVAVTVGGYVATVYYAGAAPGFPGLMQINVQIPAGFLPPGTEEVILTVGSSSSQPGVTVALQ